MSRNYELDSLKSREQDAFQRKQSAWNRYADARDRCNEAHDAMESAWQERKSASEESNREWEALQNARQNHQEIWDEYSRIRDNINPQIKSLRFEADREHKEMQNAFDHASYEYEYGDKSMAPVYAQEGRDHKERRDELNSEISELCHKVKEAKQNAKLHAPRFSADAFHRAKDTFDRAKVHHETAQAEFKRLKAERDRLKAEFDSAQAEHALLKEELQRKLEKVKKNEKTGWTHREYGTIGNGHEVTFSVGTGENSGQTLISDGFRSKRDFHKHHNHYGPNNKQRFPNQPDRIEDSDAHKDDDSYTGPGH